MISCGMLPAIFHPIDGKMLTIFKSLFTASYVSEMRSYDKEAKEKNLLFFNECGVDRNRPHVCNENN